MMDDRLIVDMYWERNEQAVGETDKKYGAYCRKISMNILDDAHDSEENVSDTYLNAWNAMPPHRPAMLAPFLGKIARNLALNRYKAMNAQKRIKSEFTISLEELGDCVPLDDSAEARLDEELVKNCVNTFLREQPKTARGMFVCRYFYCDSLESIAARFDCSVSKVKSTLFRMRNKLRFYLESEGISV